MTNARSVGKREPRVTGGTGAGQLGGVRFVRCQPLSCGAGPADSVTKANLVSG
jgi:hypothetical protein